MQTKQKLYFAYGSNLLRKQMAKRCPRCQYVGLGRLAGWRFQYDGIAKARSNMAVGNIVKSGGSEVWGAIYALCESDIKRLDKFEDYPAEYTRREVNVHLQPGGVKKSVFVYLRPSEQTGPPSKNYENIILEGAQEDGLPKDYISKYLTT